MENVIDCDVPQSKTTACIYGYHKRYSDYEAIGIPRKQWIGGVKDTLQRNGMAILKATYLAHVRRLHITSKLCATRGQKK